MSIIYSLEKDFHYFIGLAIIFGSIAFYVFYLLRRCYEINYPITIMTILLYVQVTK